MSTTELANRPQWLQARKAGIGASEAAAVLGLCPWKTALEVYMDKAGELPDRPPSPHQTFGLKFQQTIAEFYCQETGRIVDLPPQMITHPKAPWMLASMDYVVPGDRPVEVKRVNDRFRSQWGEAGSEEVPQPYFLQVQQQMACGDYGVADIAAFIGWDDFRVYTIQRNDGIISRLIEAEREFMERVERRDPPLPDFKHPSTLDLLNMIEVQTGTVIDLDAEAAALATEYEQLGTVVSDATKSRDAVKARLLHRLGEAELAWLPDGRRIKRSKVERKAYAVDANSYFKFSILKAAK